MPDHMHAIIVPSGRNTISDVMRYVKGSFSRWYNKSHNCDAPVWQPRFYDTAIRSEKELFSTIEYTEANPVQGKLVDEASSYEFSPANASWRSDLEQYYEGPV